MNGAHMDMLALALPLVAFWVCFGARMTLPEARRRFRARDARAWALDATGLLVQGWVVPLGAGWLGRTLWSPLFPEGGLAVGWWGGLTISLVFVDLLYYLNHRLLHLAWPLHRVHHSAADMDVWVSARNTAWSTAFIVYPWANALFLHVLDAPGGFLLGSAITASLDLWRHSGLPGMGLARLGLVTPRQHAWHHATERHDVNFGANWSWWDRLFGTFHDPAHDPGALGVSSGLSTWRELLWPFGGARGPA